MHYCHNVSDSAAFSTCFCIPRPFLVGDIETVTEASMLEALKPPVSRSTFEKALKICAEILQV